MRHPARALLVLALLAAPGCKRGAEDHAATGDAPAAVASEAGAPDAAGADAPRGAQAGTQAGEAGGPRGLQGGEAAHAGAPGANAAAIARREAALARARAMTFTPEAGGTYRSADGKLEITIPPGSLATKATLRFWNVDTADLPEGPGGIPGLAIDGDWGGGTFLPGAKVSFKAPVDAKFLRRVQAMGGDEAAMGVSRDAQGRPYLMVTMTADEQARPASIQQTKVGRGSVTEVAQLPVSVTTDARKAAEKAARDGTPAAAPAGTPTLAPLPANDPLVDTWPGAPAEAFHGPDFRPVRELRRGEQRIQIRPTLAETYAGDPAMLTCAVSECVAPPTEPIVEAIRLNTAIASRRQFPAALRARTANPDLGCP